MMKQMISLMVLFVILLSACKKDNESYDGFVKVKDGNFYLNGEEYHFFGANYWQGMNLGAPKGGDRERLIRELDHLQSLGLTNLRVLAASEGDSLMRYCVHPALQTGPGEYKEEIWQGLDFLLAEMAKRKMKAVMVLGNFWTWSGGFPQYLRWAGMGEVPYPQEPEFSWQNFTDYTKQFYFNQAAQEMMQNHIVAVINRVNSITGIAYKDDATIMAWQLANEPRGYDVPEAFRKWTRATSKFIKGLDANHLVCLGTEGNTSGKAAGVNVFTDNDDPNIDYITMHIWAQNWGWYKPGQSDSVFVAMLEKLNKYWEDHETAARKLNKPIVLEEFGIARDDCSYNVNSTSHCRDNFFEYIFSKVHDSQTNGGRVKGLNFWSYSGEGRPAQAGQFWKKGDPFIGDPPHELQGWYGVYNTDSTTLNLFKQYKL
jgi:mannan endo-1,4-beta-mannosidase